jgi:hypothetical protein
MRQDPRRVDRVVRTKLTVEPDIDCARYCAKLRSYNILGPFRIDCLGPRLTIFASLLPQCYSKMRTVLLARIHTLHESIASVRQLHSSTDGRTSEESGKACQRSKFEVQ